MRKRPLTERFWEKVHRRSSGECWPWMAGRTEDGYGKISADGPSRKSLRAHRVSYKLHHGSIIANLEVQHSCNNPRCVNPDHLSQDTPLVNAQYRNEQGRQARHENHGRAKFTEEQVVEIRRDYVYGSRTYGLRALGRKYEVSYTAIGKIVREEAWK